MLVGLLLSAPGIVCGQVVITEIMYDIEGTDTGREWIEIQNVGDSSTDLSTWKLFEANINHKITAVGDAMLPAQGFAVIVDNPDKFMADNPQFSGLLFDSAFSLSNDGEALVIRNEALVDIDAVSYLPAIGAAGDETTLQKAVSGWIAAMPTPGSVTIATESFHPAPPVESNSSASTTTSEDSDGVGTPQGGSGTILSDYSSHSSQAAATVSYDIPEFQVTAGRARLGFVGAPITFEAKIKAAKNLLSGGLLAEWSMGDGTEKIGREISHVYQFPGDYIVILNAGLGGSTAASKVQVRIVDPSVSIQFSPLGYVRVDNVSDAELNIGGWLLETENTRFVISRDTIISPRSSIRLPAQATRISYFAKFLRLANPSGRIVASEYPEVNELVPRIVLPEGLDQETFLRKLEAVTVQ